MRCAVLVMAALAGCVLPVPDAEVPATITISGTPETVALPALVPLQATIAGGKGTVMWTVEVDGRGEAWRPWAAGEASELSEAFTAAGVYRLRAELVANGTAVAQSEPHVLVASYQVAATRPCEATPSWDILVTFVCQGVTAPAAPGTFWVFGRAEYEAAGSLAPCPILRVFDTTGEEATRTYTWLEPGVSTVEALTWHDAAGEVGLQFLPTAPVQEVHYDLVLEPAVASRTGEGGRGC